MRSHGRPRCPGCQKHPQVCLCTGIEPVDIPHRIVIVQHPGEAWRPSSTAGLVVRLFPRASELVVRGDPAGEERLTRVVGDPANQAFLVFPEPGAPEVGEVASRGFERPPVFVVLDGSWRQARRMRRRLEMLRELPVVALRPTFKSVYRVRVQSRPAHLSTAEAVALLLGRLDGLPGPNPALQQLFESWIDRVLVLRGIAARRPRPSGRDALVDPTGGEEALS